ncbi:MAG: aKG-HExxH-type peptide beta-hydroxylase [Pseudonocardia sp.]
MTTAVRDRLLTYVSDGPDPRQVMPYDLVRPDGGTLRDVLLPLVARRNARDAVRHLYRGDASAVLRTTLIEHLSGFADGELDTFFTQPEVTAWTDRARCGSAAAEDAVELAVLLAAQHERLRGEPPERLWSHATDAAEQHTRIAGHLLRNTREGPVRHPVTEVDGVSVQGLPCAWLAAHFPEPGWLTVLSEAQTRERATTVAAALALTDRAWPAAAAEVRAILRWVVPLGIVESFNVPAMRGLLAFDATTVWRTSVDLVHEASHNALSAVLDLFDVSREPLAPVQSPFTREVGPLTSLLHSCWSFTREIEHQRRLVRLGLDIPRYVPTWRKSVRFLELAEPVLAAHDAYTPFGDALVRGLGDRAAAVVEEGP